MPRAALIVDVDPKARRQLRAIARVVPLVAVRARHARRSASAGARMLRRAAVRGAIVVALADPVRVVTAYALRASRGHRSRSRKFISYGACSFR